MGPAPNYEGDDGRKILGMDVPAFVALIMLIVMLAIAYFVSNEEAADPAEGPAPTTSQSASR